MRIPPSVIVMSLVTAVPFGLGIRDTLAHKDTSVEDEYEGGLDFGGKRSAREQRRALEEYEAEMRREAAEREARNAERVAKLDQLYGTQLASMGTLLDGISLGAGAGSFQPEDVRMRIERASRDGFINVTFDADAKALNAVNVFVRDHDSSDACEKLEDKLEAAWGKSTRGSWLDPATHQRATLDVDTCQLRFDRYLEPAEWVGQLPLHMINASVDKLTAELGGTVDDAGDDFVSWHMAGVRFGKTETKLEAYVIKGKVVGFKAILDSDFDSTLAVRDALSAKLKAQPKKDEDTGAWVWKAKFPVALEEIDTQRYALVFGKF